MKQACVIYRPIDLKYISRIYLNKRNEGVYQYCLSLFHKLIDQVNSWLKTTGADTIPFQKYSDFPAGSSVPQTAPRQSKKRFLDNVNCYDHNILGLGCRVAVPGTCLTPGPQKPTRSKSQATHLKLHNKLSEKLQDPASKGVNAHKFSQLDYLHSDHTVNYEDYRKNRVQNESELYSIRSKSPIIPHSRSQVADLLNGNTKKDPTSFCPDCYNSRVIAEKYATCARDYQSKLQKDEPLLEKLKEDSTLTKQQLTEKKLLEREILSEASPVQSNKAVVSPKITATDQKADPDIYQYEGYGTDHQKIVENAKEQLREQLRQKVQERLEQEQPRTGAKEKLMNTEVKTCGNLSLPSFNPKPNTRAEYKKNLLNQIQSDRERRMKRREQEKTTIDGKLAELLKGSYVDMFSTAKAGLKQEYYNSVKTLERRRTEKLEKREEDRKVMQAAIEEYQQQLARIQNLRKVRSQVQFEQTNATKLAEVLNKQIDDYNNKKKLDKSTNKEWKVRPQKNTEGSQKVMRTRKINETSAQNILVEHVSPGTLTTDSVCKKCTDCSKKIY
eukprot:TRINITY_DN2993_c0_g1_i1.p1 TRINITY_DN2993_c0_g1~~TRINITY_DN2993_c0_g1_i1.p1  ORF type:complete len:556 (-),score=37.12 TRINITY_DN2993_c0_g1_i1:3971-5638(-)